MTRLLYLYVRIIVKSFIIRTYKSCIELSTRISIGAHKIHLLHIIQDKIIFYYTTQSSLIIYFIFVDLPMKFYG